MRPIASAPPPANPSSLPPSAPVIPYWLVGALASIYFVHVQRKHQQTQIDEEENRTPYSEADIVQQFEFKILRDPLSRFWRKGFFDKVVQEEAGWGWQLVESFDAGRLRFKRPVPTLAEGIPAATRDPGRLYLSVPPVYHLLVTLAIILLIAGVLLVIPAAGNMLDRNEPPGSWAAWGLGAVACLVAAAACWVGIRRITHSG